MAEKEQDRMVSVIRATDVTDVTDGHRSSGDCMAEVL
jgi:hypothetical protein